MGPWKKLLEFSTDPQVLKHLKEREQRAGIGEWKIQEIEEASQPTLNCDYYPIQISKMPTIPNTSRRYTATDLLQYLKSRLVATDEGFLPVAPELCRFYLAQSEIDGPLWQDPMKLGAVVFIDVFFKLSKGSLLAGWTPDTAPVIVARSSRNEFYLQTIQAGSRLTSGLNTSNAGAHPVGGVRAFGFYHGGENGAKFTFYTIGADRAWGTLDLESVVFPGMDATWESFQSRLVEFVNLNGGAAKAAPPIRHRPQWTDYEKDRSARKSQERAFSLTHKQRLDVARLAHEEGIWLDAFTVDLENPKSPEWQKEGFAESKLADLWVDYYGGPFETEAAPAIVALKRDIFASDFKDYHRRINGGLVKALRARAAPNQLATWLSKGADPNVRIGSAGLTPLLIASKGSSFNAMKLLSQSGAQVDATDYDGKSSLDYIREARSVDRAEIEEWIFSQGFEAQKPSTELDGSGDFIERWREEEKFLKWRAERNGATLSTKSIDLGRLRVARAHIRSLAANELGSTNVRDALDSIYGKPKDLPPEELQQFYENQFRKFRLDRSKLARTGNERKAIDLLDSVADLQQSIQRSQETVQQALRRISAAETAAKKLSQLPSETAQIIAGQLLQPGKSFSSDKLRDTLGSLDELLVAKTDRITAINAIDLFDQQLENALSSNGIDLEALRFVKLRRMTREATTDLDKYLRLIPTSTENRKRAQLEKAARWIAGANGQKWIAENVASLAAELGMDSRICNQLLLSEPDAALADVVKHRLGAAVDELNTSFRSRIESELKDRASAFLDAELPSQAPNWLNDDLLGFASKALRDPEHMLREITAIGNADFEEAAKMATEWITSHEGMKWASEEAGRWAKREFGRDVGRIVESLPDIAVQGRKVFAALESEDPATIITTLRGAGDALGEQLGLQSEVRDLQQYVELASGNPLTTAKFALEKLGILEGENLEMVNTAIEAGEAAVLQFYSGNIPGAIATAAGAIGDIVGIEGLGGPFGGGSNNAVSAQRHAEAMARFDRLEAQIGALDKRVQVLDFKIDKLYKLTAEGFQLVFQNLAEIRKDLSHISNQVYRVTNQINALDRKVDEFREEMITELEWNRDAIWLSQRILAELLEEDAFTQRLRTSFDLGHVLPSNRNRAEAAWQDCITQVRGGDSVFKLGKDDIEQAKFLQAISVAMNELGMESGLKIAVTAATTAEELDNHFLLRGESRRIRERQLLLEAYQSPTKLTWFVQHLSRRHAVDFRQFNDDSAKLDNGLTKLIANVNDAIIQQQILSGVALIPWALENLGDFRSLVSVLKSNSRSGNFDPLYLEMWKCNLAIYAMCNRLGEASDSRLYQDTEDSWFLSLQDIRIEVPETSKNMLEFIQAGVFITMPTITQITPLNEKGAEMSQSPSIRGLDAALRELTDLQARVEFCRQEGMNFKELSNYISGQSST